MFERMCHIIDPFSTPSSVSRRKGPFFFKPAAFQLLSRAHNVQKSYYGPCKTNRSESGRRFQIFYYEKTLVGKFSPLSCAQYSFPGRNGRGVSPFPLRVCFTCVGGPTSTPPLLSIADCGFWDNKTVPFLLPTLLW